MKLIIFVFIGLIALTSTAFCVQDVTILVDDGDWIPYSYKDKNGNITGVYPEIVKVAISRMPDYTVKFQGMPWSRVKLQLKEGRSFAMLPPYFHAHDWLTDDEPKRPYIWPYSLPLLTQTDIVVCNAMKLETSRLNWPEDYQDLSFAIQRGEGSAGEEFNKMVEDKKIKLVLARSNLHTIKLLLLGRADCTVISKKVFHWQVNEMKKNGDYARLGKVVSLQKSKTIRADEGYLGYTDINAEKNFPFKKDFVIKFDIEIYKMKKSGEIQEIIKKYIDF
ncbi:MAG: amino acid ABC transporter substrate-binding protein [Desulfobacteraceae bacterium]|nr:amino acid ABC transporter substrate-binding protein [Desulfobacteraceae bacterium]